MEELEGIKSLTVKSLTNISMRCVTTLLFIMPLNVGPLFKVNHMMRRLRLNFYRAEDAFLILKKQQWAKEDAEFSKQQEERKRRAKNKRILRNKQRRERKEQELRSMSLPSLHNLYLPDEKKSFEKKSLITNFWCKGCDTLMKRGQNIYQCHDGHIICEVCNASLTVYYILKSLHYK